MQRQFDIRALETSRDDIERAVTEVQEYVTGLLEARRAAPGDDLISELLAARDQGDRLSAAECVQLVTNLLAGGIDTTAGQLAHAIRLFAEHPDQWALLAGEPALVPRAVEEVLRFEPVTPFTARICLEQVEHRDVIFPPGTIVAVCAERANRQGEDGESFDITAPRDTPAAHLRRGNPLLPGREPGPGRTRGGAGVPRAAHCQDSPWTGRRSWAGSRASTGSTSSRSSGRVQSTMSPNHGPAPDVS